MERHGRSPRKGLLKVLMIGQTNVGKSCITKRYVEGKYDGGSFVTIGSYFTIKNIKWDSNTEVNLQIWNLAGHESYMKLNRMHYRGTKGIIVTFDITDPSTLDDAAVWKKDVDSHYTPESGPVPAILLANKCDLKVRAADCDYVSSLDDFCKENGFKAWFETSAKENINIDKAFDFLLKEMMSNEEMLEKKGNDTERIKLGQTSVEPRSSCW